MYLIDYYYLVPFVYVVTFIGTGRLICREKEKETKHAALA